MKHVFDRKKPHQKFFEEITMIPRKSFHEKAVSDYIVEFAKNRSLWFHQDEIGNVIIKKNGTMEQKSSEPVMLQAHLDMVCEREQDYSFNFLTDSIKPIVEDGWVKAKGTTLGADDGAGVALMLAVLDETELNHPPLECIFTVQEEDGMGGAQNLDYSRLESKKLIALDGLEEGTTIVSTTGISCGYITKECPLTPNGREAFSLKVSGLQGGHAALNIGKGQGNAIKISAVILSAINRQFPICMLSMAGGTILNGIPQECETLFTIDEGIVQSVALDSTSKPLTDELLQIMKRTVDQIKQELKDNDPKLSVVLESAPKAIYAMDTNTSKEILDLINELLVGVQAWSADDPEFPIASCNLGTVSVEGSLLKIGYSCRAIRTQQVKNMVEQASNLSERFNACYQENFHYCGYTIEEDTPLIQLWAVVYREETGKELMRRRIHSGTDAGTIAENMGGMDIIVLMPNTQNVHSPEERLELASFDRTYQYLKKILFLLSEAQRDVGWTSYRNPFKSTFNGDLCIDDFLVLE